MPLVIAGIDEAGYGPLLGPMTVAMAVLRIDTWHEGDPAPDLWSLLSPQVARKPGKSGALAIDDSKKLKLSNDIKTGHPLMHLERGVLSFLRCLNDSPATPADDAILHEALGATLGDHPCYTGDPIPLPVAWSHPQLDISGNLLRAALARASISVLALRCDAIGEERFNSTIDRTNNKGDVTLNAITGHLRALLSLPTSPDDSLRLVCDRLGGRTAYADVLTTMSRFLDPRAKVRTLEENEARSRYELDIADRQLVISFQTEGDAAHLPISLASMTAKYVRELAMMRFNRHFAARYAASLPGGELHELKPTAGYRNDAHRWLHDAAPILAPEDRRTLIRRA